MVEINIDQESAIADVRWVMVTITNGKENKSYWLNQYNLAKAKRMVNDGESYERVAQFLNENRLLADNQES